MFSQRELARLGELAVLAAFVILAGTDCTICADNWPSWRGPAHNGISQEKKLPITWSDTKNVAWKVVLPGMGGSTPVVWKDHIFLTCGREKDLVLLCVSTTGKILWERKL